MQSAPARVYRSAVDKWLLVVIYASPATLLVIAAAGWVNQKPDVTGTSLILFVALTLLNLVITTPCRYTLTTDSLNIRCGLLFRSVPLARIVKIEPSSSWESAPALSLRRVKITLDQGYRIISPVDRDLFMKELADAVQRQRSEKTLSSA
jgi:membrane protein YdbS with pleckstrin-like domain